MRIPFHQFGIVFLGLSLSRGLDALPLGSIRPPQPDVAVIRSRDEILAIWRPLRSKHTLHSLGVVNVARMTLITGKDSDRPVVRGCHELFTGRREFHVHRGLESLSDNMRTKAVFSRSRIDETRFDRLTATCPFSTLRALSNFRTSNT